MAGSVAGSRDAALSWQAGDVVPFHLTWYIILASYFVSLAGALTTVELLHRRRSGTGWVSWLQLGACSVSFGLVAIWCMHFVGNRAIVLGNGEPELQLYYNPSYTALSVFLPIIFLFGAFTIAELKRKGRRTLFVYLVISGAVAGLSITGMHYVGNFGIVNYNLVNPARFVISAAALAVISCIIALTLFFLQKEMWINSLWRRLLCSTVLAGAVSGMHWVASIGTRYRLVRGHNGSGFERNTNLIVAIVMAALACLVCAFIAWGVQRRRRELADKAQQVVLASVTFDPDGWLLVTTEGLFPSRKVTRQYNQQSFDDEFNLAHPVFHWLFRVTHNWPGVADLVPAMRHHLRTTFGHKDSRPGTAQSRSSYDDEDCTDEEYSVTFRELFCVAASELAEEMNEPLPRLGVLYDGILRTGQMLERARRVANASRQSNIEDLETGLKTPTLLGKGQVLFLVREVGKAEASRLTADGFRFATVNHVGGILARSMQISLDELTSTVASLRAFCREPESLAPGGTHLACFAMRTALRTVRTSAPKWEILVPKSTPSHLPSVELTSLPLRPWQASILQRFDGMTVNTCIYQMMRAPDNPDEQGSAFEQRLRETVLNLADLIPEPFFRQASFCAKPVKMQIRSPDGSTGHVNVYAFCIIPDVHTVSLRFEDMLYTPLSFLKVRQQIYRNAPDHAILARRIHQEFGAIMSRKELAAAAAVKERHANTTNNSTARNSLKRASASNPVGRWIFSKQSSPRSSITFKPEQSSEDHELIETAAPHPISPSNADHTAGAQQSPTLDTAQPANHGILLPSPFPTSTPSVVAAAPVHTTNNGHNDRSLSSPQTQSHPWGGIMVHSDISVDAGAKDGDQAAGEGAYLGTKAEVGVAEQEALTFVDELFRATSSRFQKL